MSTKRKQNLSEVMNLAWQFVKRNGFSMSEALKSAWLNIKLRIAMKTRIVKFYYQKVDGTIREAYGTLQKSLLPPTLGTGRKANETIQTYFDTEKMKYRCYKRANIISIA
nr:MAG TPA: hypothetical protein [Caudoviricetes sp.]